MARRRNIRGGKRGIAAALAVVTAATVYGVVDVEGGFVDHPSDPGGKTRFGITEAVARDYGYEGPMSELPREIAVAIYTQNYIERPGFDTFLKRCEATDLVLSFEDGRWTPVNVRPSLGWELSDTGVNAGPGRAALWLQESLNHFNMRGQLYADIDEDGDIGPQTIAAFDALAKRRGREDTCEVLRKAVDAKQAQHYMRLFTLNEKFEDFAWGWFRTRIGIKENPL